MHGCEELGRYVYTMSILCFQAHLQQMYNSVQIGMSGSGLLAV